MRNNDLQAIGLGLATIDILICLKDMPVWEESRSISDFTIDGGGPVGTAIVAASKLGATGGYIGIAGNDHLGGLKIRTLKDAGVDISHTIIRASPEKQVNFVYVNEMTGNRQFSGMINCLQNSLNREELDCQYITSAEYLLLDGFYLEASIQAAKWMSAVDKTTILDIAKTTSGQFWPPGVERLLKYTDYLICGSGVTNSLTGKTNIWDSGKEALKLGPAVIVQTEGPQGSYTFTQDESFHIPAFDLDVVDTTGAGDVFHGAYIVGLLHGWDLRKVAVFSTAVSAISCTRLGGQVGIPSYNDTLAFLQQRNYNEIK